MYTKNAIGNLINRYRAVLSKCNILNSLGSLALVSFLGTGLLLSPMLIGLANAKTNNSTITTGGFVVSPPDSTLINNGNILGGHYFLDPVYNVNSYAGMYGSHSAGSIDYFFTNTGTIDISNISSVTSGPNASARAYGMHAFGTGNHTLTNSGDIIVSAKGGNANSNIVNVDAYAYAYGINADDDGNHTLTNSGDIIVRAEGGNAKASGIRINANTNAFAYGMYADGTGNHRLTNSGDIAATATGGKADSSNVIAYAYAYAYGMYANGTGNHNLTNSGDIIGRAEGGTADSSVFNAFASAEAYGMRAYDIGNHSLTNSGDITITAQGGTAKANNAKAYANARAYGMAADGKGNHNLTNSGHITVTARGGTANADSTAYAHAFAYGMYVEGTPTAEHLINNYGIINATATKGNATDATNNYAAAHAFEAFGDNNYSVGTFATTLQPWTVATNGTADTVFGIQTGQKINFKNTSLILRPRVTAQGVELGQVYNVSDMIAFADGISSSNGAVSIPTANEVTGNIASAIAEVPFLKATLINGADPLNATVRLDSNVNADTTPGNTSAIQSITLVQGQMSNIARGILQANYNDIYARLSSETGSSLGSLIEENKWTAFLTPYFNLADNSKYNFDGDSVGVTGGINYHVNDSFSFGAHLDFNYSNYDADIMNMDSSSTSFALGLHANYNIMPEWYISAQVTGAFTQTSNDYSSDANPYLHADNDYNSKSLYLAINSGYVFKLNNNFSIMPEIGLSYLTIHTDAYDVNWSIASAHIPAYDINYNDNSYSNLFGNININARGEWDLTDYSDIALNVGLGVRQNLTANDIESRFQTLGNSYTTSATADNTTFLADIGLEYNMGDVSVIFKYNGEYGDNQVMHGGSLTLSFDF